MYRTAIVVIAFLGAAMLIGMVPAHARCVNTAEPSCNVYQNCFARFCPCEGDPAEYFMTYGKKYCERFLDNSTLSAQGKKWRDKTLNCLQEAIVPHLDISASPSCNCRAMRKTAFDSHVACYTQAGASICDLPLSDLKQIAGTIDTDDYFTSESLKQIRAVAAICLGKEADPDRKDIWSSF